jgi:SAM-dependent methyltransferase
MRRWLLAAALLGLFLVGFVGREGPPASRAAAPPAPGAGAEPAPPPKAADKKPAEKKQQKKKEPDCGYDPTPHDIVDQMLKLADVKKGELVYDLGSGDGRIVIAAAKKYGANAVGYELDPKYLKISRRNAKTAGVADRATFKKEDIFTLDLSKVDVVTLYLPYTMNVKLLPQLQKMKPGARVVSHATGIKGYTPNKLINVKRKKNGHEHLIYLWVAPIK